jgi:hypothetical protein
MTQRTYDDGLKARPLVADEIRKRIVKVVPMRLGDILPNHNRRGLSGIRFCSAFLWHL